MGRTHHQRVALLALCLLALCPLALAACGTSPAQGPPRTAPDAPADRPTAEATTPDAHDGSAGTTPPPREVFFPTLIPRSTDVPDALGSGTLIVDRRGCLRLRSTEQSATPLWPAGFELRAGPRGLRVVDGRGRVRAKVGERVVLGGGYTTGERIEGSGALEANTEQRLLERCPGWYFITGGVVDRPSGRRGDTRRGDTQVGASRRPN